MASSASDRCACSTVWAARSNFSSRVVSMLPGYAAKSSTTHPPAANEAWIAGAMSNATESPAHTTVDDVREGCGHVVGGWDGTVDGHGRVGRHGLVLGPGREFGRGRGRRRDIGRRRRRRRRRWLTASNSATWPVGSGSATNSTDHADDGGARARPPERPRRPRRAVPHRVLHQPERDVGERPRTPPSARPAAPPVEPRALRRRAPCRSASATGTTRTTAPRPTPAAAIPGRARTTTPSSGRAPPPTR